MYHKIFIFQMNLESNIAFGFNKKDYDFEKIREVAKIAEIDEFICNDLPRIQNNCWRKRNKIIGRSDKRLASHEHYIKNLRY